MATFSCPRCPGRTFPGDIAELQLHVRDHDNPLTPDTWDARALELIRAAALTGRVFTIAEVLAPLGDYPDPGQRQFVNGQLTRRAIAADLLRDAGSQESVKPGTKRSLVHQWVGNPALTRRVA